MSDPAQKINHSKVQISLHSHAQLKRNQHLDLWHDSLECSNHFSIEVRSRVLIKANIVSDTYRIRAEREKFGVMR